MNAQTLARYWELDERRRELEREARQLKQELELLENDIVAAVRASGKNQLRRGNYLAVLLDYRSQPRWKEEFIRVAGAEAAVHIALNAPVVQRLQVTNLEVSDVRP